MQDIKSPNVLLGADHTAKIADVGLAKLQNHTYLSVHQEAIGKLGLNTTHLVQHQKDLPPDKPQLWS
jgi:serine/threonine protein kinase